MNSITTILLATGVDIAFYLSVVSQLVEENPTAEKFVIALSMAVVNAILIPLVLALFKFIKIRINKSKKLSDKQKEILNDLLDEGIDELDGDEKEKEE